MMGPGLQSINLAQEAAADVFATINRKPAIGVVDPSADDGLTLEGLEGALDFKNILFTYPSRPRNVIFQGLNLSIFPGQSVGLVGPSGSGKSTISKLLLRFYDPVAGEVSVDGVNLKLLNVAWWRNQVGYVAQEPIIFPGTVRDNIAMGKTDATDAEVIDAAKAASAHDFIMELPDQYATFYSGTSIQLSGGQMQRISIARAIIKNPVLLLLDEATSALDSSSEQVVLDAIENIRKSRQITTVSVAHRLSTIMNCDKIAVINHGHVAELGTHRQLLQLGRVYATLCESQGITLDSTAQEKQRSVLLARSKSKKIQSMKSLGKLIEHDVYDDGNGDPDVIPDEIQEEDPNDNGALKRLWFLNKPEWGYIVMGVVGAIIVGALSPTEGIFTAQIVENYYTVDPSELRAVNGRITMGFVALALGSFVFNLFLGCGFSVSGFRLTRRMRALAFDAIVRHSMGWFDRPEHSTGELTTRLEEDCGAVSKVTGWALGYKVRVIATLMTGVIIALVFSWQIGLVAIACVPVIMSAALLQARCVKPRNIQTTGLSPATVLESGLRGISSVHAYNLQAKFCEDYSLALKPYSAGKTKEGIIAGAVFGLSQCAIFMSFALLFYVGSALLIQVKIGFAEFFTAILAVMFGALVRRVTNLQINGD
jgi:ATP-binding cassette subfamily B (MDR/TAP) protein 1